MAAAQAGAADVRTDSTTGALPDFEASYVAHYPDALRLARLLVHDAESARDVVQDAFVRIFSRPRRLRDPDAFAFYLRRAVVNAAFSAARSRRAREARESRVQRMAVVADHERDPDSGVLALVDRLPPRQRAVIVLRYWVDMTEADIAQLLRCRPGTVKSLASRALATLRAEVAHD